MEIDFNKLREEHRAILDNKDIEDVAEWKQQNYEDATDEAAYLKGALANIKGIKEKFFDVVEKIKPE